MEYGTSDRRKQKRDKEVHFVMSEEEIERMREKMKELGVRSQSAYLRKMALDGYCISLDTTDIKNMVSLLRRCSANLNQYARRANESGVIYAADIRDLQARLDEIWEQAKVIIKSLAEIR